MIKWYHCIKCNYYWENSDLEYKCPQCGADAYIMLKMTPQHSIKFEKFFKLIEGDQQRDEIYGEVKVPKFEKIQTPTSGNGFATNLQDNRSKINDMYSKGTGKLRQAIEKFVKHIKVDGNNGDILAAQMSEDGIIEIINEKSGRIILWNYLTDSERLSFRQQFNELFENIEK